MLIVSFIPWKINIVTWSFLGEHCQLPAKDWGKQANGIRCRICVAPQRRLCGSAFVYVGYLYFDCGNFNDAWVKVLDW